MNDVAPTLRWIGDASGHLSLLDQTRLPVDVVEIDCRTVDDLWHAIRRLTVRGAPAIGVAAAYGVCLSQRGNGGATLTDAVEAASAACDRLATSRPTAVNLFWALQRQRDLVERLGRDSGASAATVAVALLSEARAIHAEDEAMCASIGRHGADLLAALPHESGILTHCNAGALATAGDGTALSVIFELARRGCQPHVWVDETRPLLQGARLTAWELMQRSVDCTLICDSMAASVMRSGNVQAVITGADRIAANGDAANKIGTYGLAVLAKQHDVPFYMAAPVTTFDLQLPSGDAIPIEQREPAEITSGFNLQTAPKGCAVFNPAFDVTPASLIRAIITDRGVVHGPSTQAMRALLK